MLKGRGGVGHLDLPPPVLVSSSLVVSRKRISMPACCVGYAHHRLLVLRSPLSYGVVGEGVGLVGRLGCALGVVFFLPICKTPSATPVLVTSLTLPCFGGREMDLFRLLSGFSLGTRDRVRVNVCGCVTSLFTLSLCPTRTEERGRLALLVVLFFSLSLSPSPFPLPPITVS